MTFPRYRFGMDIAAGRICYVDTQASDATNPNYTTYFNDPTGPWVRWDDLPKWIQKRLESTRRVRP